MIWLYYLLLLMALDNGKVIIPTLHYDKKYTLLVKGVVPTMKFKNLIIYIIVIILGIILLNLLTANYIEIKKAADMYMIERIIKLLLLETLYCFLFGVLLKWHSVVKLATREVKLRLNLLFIPGIILLLISSMHPYIISCLGLHFPFPRGGVGINFLIAPLVYTSNIRNILSVASGTIIIKGLYKSESK